MDDELIDPHCDQHHNTVMARIHLANRRSSVALTIDELCKILCILAFVTLESEVHFTRLVEIIAQRIVSDEQISVALGSLCKQLEHRHGLRIMDRIEPNAEPFETAPQKRGLRKLPLKSFPTST